MGRKCHCRKCCRRRHRRKRCANLPILSVTNNVRGQQDDIVTTDMKVMFLRFNTDNDNVPNSGWERIGTEGTHFKCLVPGTYRIHYTAAYRLSNIVDNALVSTSACILVNGEAMDQSITRNKDWVLSSNPMVQTHTQQKGILMNFDRQDIMSTQFSFSKAIEAAESSESDLFITTSLADEQHIDINMIQPIDFTDTESIGLRA